MIINTIFIITGIFTDWNFLKTYPSSSRFGATGLIAMAGESIHIYTVVISLIYVNFIYTHKGTLVLGFFIIGGLLLGKKAIFLFLFLLSIIHLIYTKRKFLLSITLTLIIAVLLFFHNQIVNIFLKIFPFWEAQYKNEGVVSVIFSRRDYLFKGALDYICENWNFLNYLFGGIDYFNYRSEFGFFDLFLAFGIIGFGVYSLFLIKYVFQRQTILIKLVLVNILFIDAVSGGLIINVLPAILLLLTAKYFRDNFKSNAEQNISHSNCTPG